ncbi:hypothetical protein ACHWQZ_G004877 [Mnemiopsis leidyi]
MASDVEWVEIRCPRTGEPLFANLDTGECLWEAPLGATVRAANVNQWWELYDSNSHKNYYHNSSTGETVWKKPRGAEILPLTKLQDTPGSTTEPTNTRTDTHTDKAADDPPPLTAVKQVETSAGRSHADNSSVSDPMNQYLNPSRNLGSTRRSIENLSNIDSDSEQIPDIPAHTNHDHAGNNSVRSNIEKLKQAGSMWWLAVTEYFNDLNSTLAPARRSLSIHSRTFSSTSINRHEQRFSSFHDYSAPVKYSASTPSDPRNQSLSGKENEEHLTPSMRRHSAELSPAPHKDKKGSKKPQVTRSPTSPIPKLPKEKEFVKKNINRPRGFIKKVSIATMLAHSKDQIKKPIILTQDKEVRKDAVVWFKNLQEYMGDTKVGKGLKDKERLKRAAEITFNGWQKVCFRDEFFMQVIKQTTCNPKPKSLEWGWKLISAYLYYFPPTIRFQGYLEGYLYKNKENDLNQCEVPVQMYADYCYERLAKMITRGAKHGQKKPTDDDIAHAMQLPFKKSMFGATLEEVMELQKESHPDRHLPWVLTLLADKVVLYGGYSTEGIFRVPGDIDKVCSLKVSLDNGEHLSEFPTTDAPVCASLLKEWLRELYDPAICHDTYQKCLDNCENASYCSTIVSELPDINRLVVTFVIKFLQGFLAEETIKKTKMTADNLAMVFAPNLLRCPSTDLQVAMDNSKWEMTFVRTLINNLDTSYMDGVV